MHVIIISWEVEFIKALGLAPLTPPQEDGPSPREQELKDLKESLQDTQPVGVLVDCCRTMDQVRTLELRKNLKYHKTEIYGLCASHHSLETSANRS